jgi:tRNA dimethylallyltransferase
MTILLDGIFEAKTEDPQVRQRLYDAALENGSVYLHDKLVVVDPQAAAKIHPNDTKRIVRALEVFETTGQPISELQKTRKGLRDEFDIRVFCLDMPRQSLYDRINQRVEEMFAAGAVEEVRRLLTMNLSKTAAAAIGIQEIGQFLSGAIDLASAKELMKKNTRNYAKRQLTWFRKDKQIVWVNVNASDSPESVAERILGLLGS